MDRKEILDKFSEGFNNIGLEKAKLYLACKKLEGLSNKTLYNYRLFK